MADMSMDTLLSPMLSMVLDGLLLLMLCAVWLLWWKQSRRTQRVEQGLLEAAAQLQEASSMLDDALSQIALLQQQEQSKQQEPKAANESAKPEKKVVRAVEEVDEFDGMEPEMMTPAKASLQAKKNQLDASRNYQSVAPKAASSAAPAYAGQGTMDVARILRMQREGASLESIANTLDIPLAQVKLMLMLQKGAA